MIDWNKPIQLQMWGQKNPGHNHDWEDAELVDGSGGRVVVSVTGRRQYIVSRDSRNIYIDIGRPLDEEKIGEVRNKPGIEEYIYNHPNCKLLTVYDPVEKPSHYSEGRKYETIDVIEDWDLGYHLSNALKYLSRYNRKGDGVQDLKKAVWYIQRKIKQVEQ